MSAIRLFVLSTLAERGPMHGHRMRLQVAEDRAEHWADVKPGALYGALARLSREGLVAEVRTEREGNYPERTVYEITADGRRALSTLHDQMLRAVVVPTDPFDLALAHARTVAEETLQEIVNARLLEFRARLTSAESRLAAARPWLSAAELVVSEHQIARLRVEVDWHEHLLQTLPKITREGA
ncbi:helix-turn-helix transcriptional regulator [Actinoallomurus sp. NPDC050550]|uniref:PadR family transcriptional regulator n=1 Tax=Actinoallomurus sp. NPDC050550 TaxID=3154937 RepID=UPI0033D8DA7E